MKLEVHLPPEMEPYRADLEFFFTLMVRKLHANRHKGTGMDLDPAAMTALATQEIEEVWKAMTEEGQFETAVECADVANFMFLAASSSLQMTREQFRKLGEDKPEHVHPVTLGGKPT